MLIAFNRPFGVICRIFAGARQAHAGRLHQDPQHLSAGRLDTDSGRIAAVDRRRCAAGAHRRSLHKLAKVYWAQVEGTPTGAALTALRNGVKLNDFTLSQPAPCPVSLKPLAARSADSLPRQDPHDVVRADPARRQEPPGAAHDGARRLPDAALGASGHRKRQRPRIAARDVARGRRGVAGELIAAVYRRAAAAFNNAISWSFFALAPDD